MYEMAYINWRMSKKEEEKQWQVLAHLAFPWSASFIYFFFVNLADLLVL